jgi:hypothetical protein
VLRVSPLTRKSWFHATWEHKDNVRIDQPPPPATVKRPNGEELTPSFNAGGFKPAPPPPGPNPPPYSNGHSYEPTKIEVGSRLRRLAPVGVTRHIEISAGASTANAEWLPKLNGTVWTNYELIEVTNPAIDDTHKCIDPIKESGGVFVNTCEMANTVIETYTQRTSCTDCHYQGCPLGDDVSKPKYQIFIFSLRDAEPAVP